MTNVPANLNQYVSSTGVAPDLASATEGIRYRGQAPTPSTRSTEQPSQERFNHLQSELDAVLERWRATAPSSMDRANTLREELRRRGVLTEDMERMLQASSSHLRPSPHPPSPPIDPRANSTRYNPMGPWDHNPAPAEHNNAGSANPRFSPLPTWNTPHSPAPTNTNGVTSFAQDPSRMATSENHRWAMPPSAASLYQNNTNPTSGPILRHGAHLAPTGPATSAQSDPAADRYLEQVQGWQSILLDVTDMENLVNLHIIPSVDMMFRIRTQLQNMLAERQNQDTERIYSTPSDHRLFPLTAGAIEVLMDRVTRLYERVDQITTMQQAQRFRNAIHNHPYTQNEPSRIYLATHPDGRQSLILPPDTTIRTSVEGPSFRANAAPIPEPHTNPNAANVAAVQNAVRQALINQQQRRDANGVGIGRYIRRVWLFIRMYFFCYMISDAGTWTRIFLVTCAVIISLLGDTNFPQQLHGAVVAPIQRHLEGLAHMGGPADQSTQAPNQGGGNHDNHGPGGIPGDILHFLRRAERSIVLLLASLVPGIGERQVEARNAAEAEQVRREEQEQEQERERERVQELENERERDQAGSGAAAAATAPTTIEQPEQTVS